MEDELENFPSRGVEGEEEKDMNFSNSPKKKRRNLPGMPDPNSEVVALSPKSLLATNRFVCEVCSKGFQRDQNLQLHRRGHNLPWKLKSKNGKEQVKRKVYVCPEVSCVHHNPERALGDLTGIKKHFSRKHGEKKWKCDRCSKLYAVQSDWKAHAKVCGSKEYKCDCGTLFSRRDSFITHRAFCDALAEESAKAAQTLGVQTPAAVVGATTSSNENKNDSETTKSIVAAAAAASSPPPPPPLTPSATVISPVLSMQSPELPENSTGVVQQTPSATTLATSTTSTISSNSYSYPGTGSKTSVFASIFAPSTATPSSQYNNLISSVSDPSKQHLNLSSSSNAAEITSLHLSPPALYLSNTAFSLFPLLPDHHEHCYAPPPQPTMSATALLQKAAEMGAKASNSSFLCGFGLSMPSSSSSSSVREDCTYMKKENNSVAAGLGLGLGSGNVTDMMVGSSFYGSKPPTLDFLGLGRGASGNVSTTGNLSALLNSMGGVLDVPPETLSFNEGSPPSKSSR